MFLPFPSVLVVDFGIGLDVFEPIECMYVCMHDELYLCACFLSFFAGNLCDSLPDDWSALLSFGVSCSAKTCMHIINICTVISLDVCDIILEVLGDIVSLAVSVEVSESLRIPETAAQ